MVDFDGETLAGVIINDVECPDPASVCELDRLTAQRRHPARILTDNGPEITSKVLDRWAYEHCVEHQFIQPGKPVQNAFIESFNGTMRNECLNEHWFVDLEDARELIEA